MIKRSNTTVFDLVYVTSKIYLRKRINLDIYFSGQLRTNEEKGSIYRISKRGATENEQVQNMILIESDAIRIRAKVWKHWFRKVFGMCFGRLICGGMKGLRNFSVIVGLIITVSNIIRCIRSYLLYKSQVKPMVGGAEKVMMFPKVTICLNSIHSKWKIQKNYPNEAALLLKYLDQYYGKGNDECKNSFKVATHAKCNLVSEDQLNEIKQLDTLNMQMFAHDTSPDYEIEKCSYLVENCQVKWRHVHTKWGHCIEYNPHDENLIGGEIIHAERKPCLFSISFRFNNR